MVFHNLKDINVTPPPTEQPEGRGSFEYGCGILYRTTYYRDGVVLNSKNVFQLMGLLEKSIGKIRVTLC